MMLQRLKARTRLADEDDVLSIPRNLTLEER